MHYWQSSACKLVVASFICVVLCQDYNSYISLPATDLWENSNLSITCSVNVQTTISALEYVKWKYVKGVSLISEFNVPFDYRNCSEPVPLLIGNNIYSSGCSQFRCCLTKTLTGEDSGGSWSCRYLVSPRYSNTVTVFLNVPVLSVNITPYQNHLTLAENSGKSLTCKSSACRPAPSFQWIISRADGQNVSIQNVPALDSYTDIREFVTNLTLVANKSLNGGKLFCTANNRNNTAAVVSNPITLNVQYPPEAANRILGVSGDSVYNVILGSYVNLTCVVNGGNPLPILKWNIVNTPTTSSTNDTVISKVLWQASVQGTSEIICYSIHPMRNDTANLSASILYAPDTPTLTLRTTDNKYILVQSIIRVVEDSSISLTCSADSNPPPNKFSWSRFSEDNSPILNITRIRRSDAGQLECYVFNEMIPTKEGSIIGSNMTQVFIDVLYGPRVKTMSNSTIVEGIHFLHACSVEHGNPNTTLFTWRNDTSGKVVHSGQNMTLTNVSRYFTGFYMCEANNTMMASDGTVQNGSSTGQIFLNVQYACNVSWIVINNKTGDNITVNEDENVTIICQAEGNPSPSGNITFSKQIYGGVSDGLNFLFSPSGLFARTIRVSCYDAGEYNCSVSNTLHTGEQRTSFRSTRLYVNCSPRMSKYHHTEKLVYSTTNVPVTISFTAVAYPVPSVSQYTWNKKDNGTFIKISELNNATIISTEGLQSNLTFLSVNEHDFGEYKLVIENEIGSFSTSFYLKAAGKPEDPSNFANVEERTTDSSITLTWTSGFAGGGQQTFVLRFAIKGSLIWSQINIPESETDPIIYSVQGLHAGMVYVFELYSFNSFGRSSTVNITSATLAILQRSGVSSALAIGIGGGVGGSIFLAVAVITIVLVLKRRWTHQKKQNIPDKKPESNVYENITKEDTDKGYLLNNRQEEPESNVPSVELQEIDDKPEDTKVYGEYEMFKRKERVSVVDLYSHLRGKPIDYFGAEFMNIPGGLTMPYEFSQRPENRALNRYNRIYPYDHSRVTISSDDDFFINACYIDGLKSLRTYIASLGPTEKTTKKFETFWKMVWNEKSDVIVMLTQLVEPSGIKCDRYWPERGCTKQYGDILVTSETEHIFAEYIQTNLIVAQGQEQRKLMHFYFTAWPDKYIPEDVTSLIEFRRRVKLHHFNGPLIVHCSAGIGRTGTLIALDILITEGQCKGYVNVFQCVKTMRNQRTNMVQTAEQYYYIYKALVNVLVFGGEYLTAEAIQNISTKGRGKKYLAMFEKFNKTVETDSLAESNAKTANKLEKTKNRFGTDIPGDANRVPLRLNKSQDTSDYINAVFVSSFIEKDHFIVAQTPLENGVEDFLTMIYEQKLSCIVSLNGSQQLYNVGQYLPSETNEFTVGNFHVTSKRQDVEHSYIGTKIELEYSGKDHSGRKSAYHFLYTDWPLENKVPNDPRTFMEFVKNVEGFAKSNGAKDSHVLLHCLTASERCGLFCAAVNLTEKLTHEGEVCVENTLRKIRTRRRKAIPNAEQFQFCFELLSTFAAMENTGYEADQSSYVNMTLV